MPAIPGNQKKISLLITTANLDHGGVEEVILEYAKRLDKHRIDVTVGCLVYGRVAREIAALPGVTVVHIDSKSRIVRLVKFWKLARAVRPHIVHNHACWYGLIAGFLAGSRSIETIHNVFVWFTPLERLFYGMYSLLADKIISVSEYVREYSAREIPFMRPDRMCVVRNGIDVPKYQIPKEEPAALRKVFGIGAGTVIVGFIGRLTRQKGVRYLLEAAADPIVSAMRLQFVIVGEGELRAELERNCSELGVKNVLFTGYRRDVPQLMAMFDIFVLPSLWEGLPVSVLEATAGGCPVIATRVSGTPEVIIDGVNGCLVEPENVRQLAEKIALLAADASLRARMGKAGRERAAEFFSADRMVQETVKVYNGVLTA